MQHKPLQAIKTLLCRTILSHCYLLFVSAVFLTCLLSWSSPLNAEPELSPEKKAAELDLLRTQIKDVESNIQAARAETNALYNQLQPHPAAAANISKKLRGIDAQIKTKVTRLAELNVEKEASEKTLVQEQDYLSQQIRAAYKMGQNDYLKLLLNIEDPALVGRMLVYYEYYNRARTSRIKKIAGSLEEILRLENSIQSETEQLEQLRSQQLAKLEEFTKHRISRKKIIARLKKYIEEKGEQLQVLQQNEQELESLVNQLREQQTTLQTYEEAPPFKTLKGKLKWPVNGKFINRFGSPRKGGKLKWQGVTLAANSGEDVIAISTAKVVFADWFRNMGLLIILDHGDGYMSLYGHNERLLKKVGDIVLTGESIAKAGDTGGQQKTNLYFEIRQSGDPVNPALWCKG